MKTCPDCKSTDVLEVPPPEEPFAWFDKGGHQCLKCGTFLDMISYLYNNRDDFWGEKETE